MRGTRTRLQALGATAVIVALVAAAAAFNLFIGWKVESDAIGDISYALGLTDATVTGRSPNYLLLDPTCHISEVDRWWSTPDEVRLAAWFEAHPEQYVVHRVALPGWTCYAAMAPASDFYVEDASPDGGWQNGTEQDGSYVVYIDIASEQSLIATVNTAFAAIALVGAVLAACAGSAAGRRIEAANEAQKRFYENMSHDLKTPLAAIRGYAEGAAAGVVDEDEAMRAIVNQTDRMSVTINEILGLSRLESGIVTPRTKPLEVADFVQDCLMPMEGAIRARSIAVELDLAEGSVMADADLFDHALSNVLSNAVRHAATMLHVAYDGRRLAVTNDGDVPAPEDLPQLFDRYRTGAGGSTGVGLAIAREVADLHGWRLTARFVEDGLEVAFVF